MRTAVIFCQLYRTAIAAALLSVHLLPASAQEGPCSNPNAIGTSRVITVVPGPDNRFGPRPYRPLPLDAKEVVLTFDDGPRNETSRQVLDILRRECIRATFFIQGNRAMTDRSTLEREVAEGHSIGTHTWSHKNLSTLAPDAAEKEIQDGVGIVESFTGSRPVLFRYPEFRRTEQLDDWLTEHDMVPMAAELSPADWRGDPPEVSFKRLVGLLEKRDRGIVLMHDVQKNTPALLVMAIAYFKEHDFKIVHVDAQKSGFAGH